MEVIAAAGFCAPGCAAAVSAIAGGPILGAVGLAAAVGYGVYSMATGGGKADSEDFQDAIEDEEDLVPSSPVVKIARHTEGEQSTSQPDHKSFL